MITSERSESINSFFDGYVNSNTLLNEFVSQYDKAILSRRKKKLMKISGLLILVPCYFLITQ